MLLKELEGLIQQARPHACRSCDTLMGSAQAESHIGQLKEELEVARTERRHKEEYEVQAQEGVNVFSLLTAL